MRRLSGSKKASQKMQTAFSHLLPPFQANPACPSSVLILSTAAHRSMMRIMSMCFIVAVADSQAHINHTQQHKDKSLNDRNQRPQQVERHRNDELRQIVESLNDLMIPH